MFVIQIPTVYGSIANYSDVSNAQVMGNKIGRFALGEVYCAFMGNRGYQLRTDMGTQNLMHANP